MATESVGYVAGGSLITTRGVFAGFIAAAQQKGTARTNNDLFWVSVAVALVGVAILVITVGSHLRNLFSASPPRQLTRVSR